MSWLHIRMNTVMHCSRTGYTLINALQRISIELELECPLLSLYGVQRDWKNKHSQSLLSQLSHQYVSHSATIILLTSLEGGSSAGWLLLLKVPSQGSFPRFLLKVPSLWFWVFKSFRRLRLGGSIIMWSPLRPFGFRTVQITNHLPKVFECSK